MHVTFIDALIAYLIERFSYSSRLIKCNFVGHRYLPPGRDKNVAVSLKPEANGCCGELLDLFIGARNHIPRVKWRLWDRLEAVAGPCSAQGGEVGVIACGMSSPVELRKSVNGSTTTIFLLK